MATFSWDITEGIPHTLSSATGGAGGVYTVTLEDYDIAVGNLPFLLFAGDDQPYERMVRQWRKDQFDSSNEVGEQSLTGWWLRSQSDFSGGDGIVYNEPLLGEGSTTRFRDSRRVDVFTDDGSVSLLPDTTQEVTFSSADVEALAGPTRVLLRDGGDVSVWDGTTESAVSGTSTANSLAYTGSLFLVGDDTDIYTLSEDSGTSLSSIWNSGTGGVQVWWAKQRIFAAMGAELYELTLSGGDLSAESPLFTHPDDDWEWVSVTETGNAVWAAGRSGDRSAVHVIDIDESGATPTLTGATTGIQLPLGETVNAMQGYLDFLLLGTSAGFRVAVVNSSDQAALGGLIWRDEAVLSLAARGDFAWCGLAEGLTRKVDLGNEVAGDLLFAWAHDMEASGDILSLTFYDGRLGMACNADGFYLESDTDLAEDGYVTTGFTRFGTLENKHFRTALVNVDTTNGTIIVAGGPDDPFNDLITIGNRDGHRNLNLHYPGGVGERVGLSFTLNRDDSDATAGPTLVSYQIRALPAPDRRTRLVQIPLLLNDRERNRYGVPVGGGPGFAWVRLKELEGLERDGAPVVFQDFRTGESRTAMIDRVHFSGPESPDQSEGNFGGTIALRLELID